MGMPSNARAPNRDTLSRACLLRDAALDKVGDVMKRGDIAFGLGVMVTILTTLGFPGGLLQSFIAGTICGVLAVGVATLVLDILPRR